MDLTILKKRLSTFKTEGGSVTKVADDLLIAILRAWESWTGTAREFHTGLGLTNSQLGGLIGKAKKLARDGGVTGEFQQIQIAEGVSGDVGPHSDCGIEVTWEAGKVIRFSRVELLIDFLKKVA